MTGEYLTQPMADYLADKRLSNSGIELWRNDRADYEAMANGTAPPFEVSDEMKFGNYFEALLFGYGTVKTDYVVAPAREDDPDKVIHRGSKEYKDFAKGVAGRKIIMPEHANRAMAMIEAVAAHPIASKLVRLGRGTDQLVLRWDCPHTGLPKKGRPDRAIIRPRKDRDIIIDLKTDRDPRDTMERRRRWHNMGYHRKMAGYAEGWKEITGRDATCFIVAVSNTGPVRCCVYHYDHQSPAILTGHAENRQSTIEIATAMRTGFWGYPEETTAVEGAIPPWAITEAENIEEHYDQAS